MFYVFICSVRLARLHTVSENSLILNCSLYPLKGPILMKAGVCESTCWPIILLSLKTAFRIPSLHKLLSSLPTSLFVGD